jgi:hypothetical protein
MSESYWLYDWIDETAIKTSKDAKRVVQEAAALDRLRERASEVKYGIEPLDVDDEGMVLVAGRGIDLSGELECNNFDCKRQQVDRLFSRAWHYFDKIVVVASEAHEIQHLDPGKAGARDRIEHEINLLLYLREIGAEKMLLFRQKYPACREHGPRHLANAGMTTEPDVIDALAKTLEIEGEILSVDEHDDHVHYFFYHESFEHAVNGVAQKKLDTTSLKAEIARDVVGMFVSCLASDVATSRYLKSPLGSDLEFYRRLFEAFHRPVTEEDVAVELQLPFLDGIAPRELLKLRAQERDAFDRFRLALRSAIRQRIEVAVAGTNVTKIAREIERDVLHPALADIRQRLSEAQRLLTRKALVGLTVGAAATTCGLLLNIPLLTVTGVGTTMTALSAEFKFLEEKRDIRLSEMYFLWKGGHNH